MKNILIVEDEEFALEDLRETLLGHFPALKIAAARNATDAMSKLSANRFDAVFLDIELPGMNGLEMLRNIPEPRPPVVLVTAHAFNALDGFGLGVVECLLKPVDEDRLRRVVQKLCTAEGQAAIEPVHLPIGRIVTRDSVVVIRAVQGYRTLRGSEIIRLEEGEKATHVFFEGGKGFARARLDALEPMLDPEIFFRANAENIVNLERVTSLEGGRDELFTAVCSDGARIPLSRDRSQTLEQERLL